MSSCSFPPRRPLPYDVLVHDIAPFLPWRACVHQLSVLCRALRRALQEHLPLHRTLELPCVGGLSHVLMNTGGFSFTVSLELRTSTSFYFSSSSSETPHDLRDLARLMKLRLIRVRPAALPESLKLLSLRFCNGLQFGWPLSRLEVLSLWYCDFPALDCSTLPRLRVLNLFHDTAMDSLTGLPPGLEVLGLSECYRFTSLEGLPSNLQTLSLAYMHGLMVVELPQNLKNFKVVSCRQWVAATMDVCKGTGSMKSDPSSGRLPKIMIPRNVEFLILNESTATSQGLEHLESLKILSIAGCRFLSSENVPKHLVFSKSQLLSLDLSGCSAVQDISSLPHSIQTLRASHCSKLTSVHDLPPNLKSLDLSKCTNLTIFTGISRPLEFLDLSCCFGLDDQSLMAIEPAKIMYLAFCSKITDVGFSHLCNRHRTGYPDLVDITKCNLNSEFLCDIFQRREIDNEKENEDQDTIQDSESESENYESGKKAVRTLSRKFDLGNVPCPVCAVSMAIVPRTPIFDRLCNHCMKSTSGLDFILSCSWCGYDLCDPCARKVPSELYDFVERFIAGIGGNEL